MIIDGVSNFRDLAEFATLNGKSINRNYIFRSNNFADITIKGIAQLEKLNPSIIIDFRNENEILKGNDKLPKELEKIRINMPIKPLHEKRLSRGISDGTLTESDAADLMKEIYKSFVTDHMNTYLNFLKIVIKNEKYPIIYHCTAGKDRTGLASAMILKLLGFDQSEIFKDFLATNSLWRPSKNILNNFPKKLIKPLLGVSKDYLNTSLEIIGSNEDILNLMGSDRPSEEEFNEFKTKLGILL